MTSSSQEASPEAVGTLRLMVALCIAEDQLEQAADYSRSLIERCPDQPETYLELGELWLQYHHPEIAMPYFQKALQNWPEIISLYEDLIKVLIENGDVDTVINLSIHLLCVQPDWIPGFLAIGYCLQQKGRHHEAQSCISMKLLESRVIEDFADPKLEWQVARELGQDDISVAQIYPSERYRFPSEHIELINNQSFSDFNHGFESKPAEIVTVHNAYFWLDAHTRVIFSSEHTVVESASLGNVALVAASQYLPEPLMLAGNVVCCGTRYAYSYFHWLFDVIPKIGLLQEQEDLQKIDRFIFNKTYERFHHEIFSLLGLTPDKLLFVNKIYARCKKLFIPLFSFNKGHFKGYVSQPVCKYLRSTFLDKFNNSTNSYPRRLYISRSRASHRRLLNEGDIIETIDHFGFEVVRPEELSFTEQVKLFQQASAIVASHGAGLSNIVFCQPHTKVIELFGHQILDYYWIISNHVGLDYYYVRGELAQNAPPIMMEEAGFRIPQAPLDFTVSPTSLLTVLEMAGLT